MDVEPKNAEPGTLADPRLVLGDPRLDSDHAELRRLTRQLQAAHNQAEALAALDALSRHAAAHFATEDEDLRAMKGNDDAQCHVDEHAAVLKSLAEVQAWTQQNGDAAQLAFVVQSLCAELDRWLPEHVQYMDAAVAAYRSKNRFGGVPILFPTRQPRSGS
jgi:hemerythrin-like metal-binding protein